MSQAVNALTKERVAEVINLLRHSADHPDSYVWAVEFELVIASPNGDSTPAALRMERKGDGVGWWLAPVAKYEVIYTSDAFESGGIDELLAAVEGWCFKESLHRRMEVWGGERSLFSSIEDVEHALADDEILF